MHKYLFIIHKPTHTFEITEQRWKKTYRIIHKIFYSLKSVYSDPTFIQDSNTSTPRETDGASIVQWLKHYRAPLYVYLWNDGIFSGCHWCYKAFLKRNLNLEENLCY